MKEFGCLSENAYKDMFRVNNAAAFSNPANYGMEQTLSTLTQIVRDVQRQKFYQLAGQALTDFVPIEMGVGGYSTNLFQYAVANVGDSFETGIVQPGNGINKDAQVDIVVDKATVKNNFWRMKYEVTKEILEMGRANQVNFSYVEEQERARLKTFQLGIQNVAFNGTSDGLNFGLLNQEGVTVNTSLLPTDIASMTYEQLNNFAKTAMATFFANSNSTVLPNRWLMPTSDFMTLGTQFNPQFPVKSTREILEDAFRGAGAPADFRIVHTIYNNTAGSNGTARHLLYNCDADTLTMYLPKPYTPYPLFPTGALDMISDAEAQFTGVWVKRPKELLYMDVATPST